MPSLRDKPHLLIAVVVVVVALVEFSTLGLFSSLENASGDLLLRQHAQRQRPDPDVLIIDIDERSLDAMADIAGRWPWPRAVHAELLAGLAKRAPAAIVFDIQFTDPDLLQPGSDTYLGEVAQAMENAFFPFLRLDSAADPLGLSLAEYGTTLGFTPKSDPPLDRRIALALPLRPIALTGRIGAINFLPDDDGVGRRYWLHLPVSGWQLPSLPARLAHYFNWPLPASEAITLNWRGQALSYPRISYVDLYQDLSRRESQRPAGELHGKILIIGSTASGLGDLRVTPIDSLHPAMEILATAIDNLKNRDPLIQAPSSFAFILTLLLVGLLTWAFRRQLSPLQIGSALLLASPALPLAAFVALGRGVILPVITPLVFAWLYYAAAALHAWWQERRERQRSVAMFSRFLDPRVVKDLVGQGDTPIATKGQTRQVSVLFSDIRSFTTFSEAHTAEQVVEMLNDYFSRQVRVIFNHGGTIDKFIGDAIMAFWGAPVDDSDHARHAVKAALDMADTLLAYREERGGELAAFDVGIGIHSGPAVVGFIGADNRLDYTAIGDTVNLASRIEGQTKGVARILVSADTRELCGDTFDFIDHGFYKVKGRNQEVQLFEPKRKTQ